MYFHIHRDCIIGTYIAKEFIVDLSEEMQIFIGVVKSFDQRTNLFACYYDSDDTTEYYDLKEVKECISKFEEWYSFVSNHGQRFTRKQACPVILKSYRQQKFLEVAKESNPSDPTTCTTSSADKAKNEAIAKEN